MSVINDISSSFFISANAGSGKTSVIISRLIFKIISGIKLSKILCITYTNTGVRELLDRVNKICFDITNLQNEEEFTDYLREKIFIDVSKFNKPIHLKQVQNLINENIINDEKINITTFHEFCFSIVNRFDISCHSFKIENKINDINANNFILTKILSEKHLNQYLEIFFDSLTLEMLKTLISEIIGKNYIKCKLFNSSTNKIDIKKIYSIDVDVNIKNYFYKKRRNYK